MKILELQKLEDGRVQFVALIYGKEYKAFARNLDHMAEKILHADKHATKEEIDMDLELNYKHIIHEKTDSSGDATDNSQPSADAK